MGIVKDAVLLKTLENAAKQAREDAASLLAEQRRTNELLTHIAQALSSRQAAPQATSWGQR